MILALFDRLGVNEAESFDHIHGLVEATKRALRVRDRAVTDPSHLPYALDRCPRSALHRRRGDEDRPPQGRALAGRGTATATPSGWARPTPSGLVVSYIQSIYWEFGSGCVLPATGVLMQNRGTSFSLDPRRAQSPGARPAAVPHAQSRARRAHRRPRHGLRRMGGDGQPQTQGARVHPPRRCSASRSPRRSTGRAGCSAAPGAARRRRCAWNPRFDGNLIDALVSAGHDVDVLSEPYSDTMGHAGAVVLHPDGSLEGAHDPRADGGAAGV